MSKTATVVWQGRLTHGRELSPVPTVRVVIERWDRDGKPRQDVIVEALGKDALDQERWNAVGSENVHLAAVEQALLEITGATAAAGAR